MSTSRVFFLLALLILAQTSPAALGRQDDGDDQEIARHLNSLKLEIDSPNTEPSRREDLVFEAINMLDRAALRSRDAAARERNWDQAIGIVDGFLRSDVTAPRERVLRLRAGIFRWAMARSERERYRLDPRDAYRSRAIADLDDAIRRLRDLSGRGGDDSLAEEQRFRLAQALADRAELEPADSALKKQLEAEAARLLEPPPRDPTLTGYWKLLQADLFKRQDQPVQAERYLHESHNAASPPAERDWITVKLAVLTSTGRFDDAALAIKQSKLDPKARALELLKVRLAQRKGSANRSQRPTDEADLWTAVRTLCQGEQTPETTLGLRALASADLDQAADLDRDAWEALATAYGLTGDLKRSARALEKAADRASAAHDQQAAVQDRLKAGASYYRADALDQAARILQHVFDDPAAPVSAKARAGMLRILVLRRQLNTGNPAKADSYRQALERQIHDFPSEPVTDQARTLLADLLVSTGDHAAARPLYAAVSPRSPDWLTAQLAIARIDLKHIERMTLNPDLKARSQVYDQAARTLDEALRIGAPAARTPLELARARLALEPELGDPRHALELCDQILARGGDPHAVDLARLYRLVALVATGRYLEAERGAQRFSRANISLAELLDIARILDQTASTADNDLRTRRFGLMLRLLIMPILEEYRSLDANTRAELALRATRALIHMGDDRAAKASMNTWRTSPDTNSDLILRDLGDTYIRLGAPLMAIDVERLRLRNNPPGSIEWLDARYALALAYYRTGKSKEAAELIEATAILHPDLGGPRLKEKFVRLRQRIGDKR